MADRIGIIVELTGDKEAESSLKNLRKLAEELKRQKVTINIDDANAKKALSDITKELDSLEKDKHQVTVDVDANKSGLDDANGAIKEMTQNAYTLKDVLSGLGDLFSTIGSGMQSIGRMFNGGDAWSTVKKVVTAYGTILSAQNVSAAAERFDVLRTYTDYLGMMGSTADEAQDSLDAINKAIQGLPIGLSDVAFQVRRFQMFTGSLGSATDIAIGLNKALVGGGASQSMRTTALHEVERLLTTGSLAQSRQWLSLLNGLGVSTQFLKEQMGYATMENKDFADSLAKGKIPVEEFLEGLAALADSTTVGGQKLDKALEIYKTTIESAMSNIGFAVKRGMANVMQAMDDTLISIDGGGIAGHMNMFRDELNKIFSAISEWVKANPDKIEDFMNRVKGIWDRVKQFDWGGLAGNILDAMGNMVDIATKIYDMLPEDFIKRFITFGMVYATPLGKAFSALGGIFKGLATLNLAGIPIFGTGRQVTNTIASFGDLGRAFAAFTMTVGEIAEVGLVIAEYAKVIQIISDLKIGDDFAKNAELVALSLLAGGAVTGVITGLMSLAGKSGVGGIGVGIGELLTAGFIAELGLLGQVIEKYADVCQKIGDLNVNWEKTNANALGLSMVMTELNLAAAVNSLAGIPGAIGAAELSAISDAVSAVIDAMDQIANANFPTPEKLRLAKEMFGNLADVFDLGALESIGAFFSNLFGVYSANKTNIEQGLETLKMFDEVSEVVNGLAGKTIKADAAGSNLSTLVQSLAKMTKDVRDAFGGELGTANAVRFTSNESKVLENVSKLFTNLGDVMKQIRDIQTAYFGQGKIEGVYQPSVMSGFKETKQNIEDFIKGVAEILSVLNPQNSPATALQGEWETSSEARMLANIQKAFSSIGDMLTTLRGINKTFGKLSKGGQSVGGAVGYAIANIRTVMTQLSGLFSDKLFQNLPDLGKVGIINETTVKGSTSGKIANIAMAVESLKDIMYALRVINGNLASGKGESIDFGTVTGNIKTAIEGLNSVFEAIPEDMGDVLGRATALQNAVVQLQAVVTTLQGIQTSLSGEEGSMDTGGLTQMISDITNALSSVQVDTSGLDAIAASVENLKNMLSEASQVDFSGLSGQVDSVKSGIGSLRDEAVSAKAALENLGSAGSSALGRIAGMFQSIVAQCNSAIGAVRTLQSAINALHGKTVNINVQKTGSVSMPKGAGYASTGGFISRNGVLYRAYGGSVFRPRGTDTIPAMLTPGEYVMRRKAVQAFGVDFMRNINRLNIPAALRTLVSRTSLPGANSTVINNSRDNHATVNQNFYNSNPAYGFRRANRYVEAL